MGLLIQWLKKKFKRLTRKLDRLMGLVEDLNTRIDTLNAKSDAEHDQVAAALAELKTEIENLKGQIVPDSDAAAILARLDTAAGKIENIFTPDTPPDAPTA